MTGARDLTVNPVHTRTFIFREELFDFVAECLPRSKVKEGAIVAVTSKIVSLSEGCRVPTASIGKKALVQREADRYLGDIGYGCYLTIKHGLMIASAGIDESNSDGDFYITFPRDPYASARRLWKKLKKYYRVKNLGVLVTDSHTTPLRRGVTGVALAYWGFQGVRSRVGVNDLFGRPLKMTHVNFADALAASAVLMMGEAAESCPLAVIHCGSVKFQSRSDQSKIKIPLEEDLYRPILKIKARAKTSKSSTR